MTRLAGKTALITGAARGIGLAFAEAYAAEGARVAIADIDIGRARRSAEALDSAAIAVEMDVTRQDSIDAAVTETVERLGRIDILINNAGILRDKSFSKMELADFRTVLDVHLMGSVNCTKAVWEIMKAQEYGRIVICLLYTSDAADE